MELILASDILPEIVKLSISSIVEDPQLLSSEQFTQAVVDISGTVWNRLLISDFSGEGGTFTLDELYLFDSNAEDLSEVFQPNRIVFDDELDSEWQDWSFSADVSYASKQVKIQCWLLRSMICFSLDYDLDR